MIMHDFIFFHLHRFLHNNKSYYRILHQTHHEYSHAMNVFTNGYAEAVENFIQVGLPWLFWTVFVDHVWKHQIILLVLPLSVTLFTTLIGHSGYKNHRIFAIFHPAIAPLLLMIGAKHMLTPGDHQVHHGLQRYNFALFFRTWDKYYGTYRKCQVEPHDVHYWNKHMKDYLVQKSTNEKVAIDFVETTWGFWKGWQAFLTGELILWLRPFVQCNP